MTTTDRCVYMLDVLQWTQCSSVVMSSWAKLGNPQLRELCSAFNLPTDGTKADLVERLESAPISSHVAAASPQPAAAPRQAAASAGRAMTCVVQRQAEAFLGTLGITPVRPHSTKYHGTLHTLVHTRTLQ